MGHDYKAVQWTPYKKTFDIVLLFGAAAFITAFVLASAATLPPGQSFSEIQLLIRAFGAAAFSLLTLILCIGPAARLSPRFLPLLYNRRHLGVTCFALALVHAALVLLWYHGFSNVNPLVSLLVSNPRYESIQGFPFESLGLLALFILFVMAATSHDFWNANLGPKTWKAIHMAVYWAYGLLVAHILLGAVQAQKSLLYPALVGAGALITTILHLIAGARETAIDAKPDPLADGWLSVTPLTDIPEGRAVILTPPVGEKIAVFKKNGAVYALSNVCRHQGGPLGEGQIIDGCVTCPWHGFQYRPEDGRAPPPYAERVATYRTRILGDVVYVHPEALFAAALPVAAQASGGAA